MEKTVVIALAIIGVCSVAFNIDFLIATTAKTEAKEMCLKYWHTDRAQITSHGTIYCEHKDNNWQEVTAAEIIKYRKNK